MSSDYIKAKLVAKTIEDAERKRLQDEADRKLGKLVRKLSTLNIVDNDPTCVVNLAYWNNTWAITARFNHAGEWGPTHNISAFNDDPIAALLAAGVSDE